MNKNEFIKELEKLQKEFQDKETKCYENMAFMRQHKFNMEEEAIRYKAEAYNDAWLTVWHVIDKIQNK